MAWDKTLSTKKLKSYGVQGGSMKPHRRKKRDMVDRIAAAVILQDYLNKQARNETERPAILEDKNR